MPYFLKSFFLLILLTPLLVSADFNRNLYYGLRRDPEVVRLQDFLRSAGFFSDNSTGNFLGETLKSVKKFQFSQNISSTGYFGPLTRAVANRRTESKLAPVPKSAVSPYKNKIYLQVSPYGEDPRFESATLENRTDKENISITGLSVENSKGEKFIIPRGFSLPGFEVVAGDIIILKPGERAVITVGKQEKNMDFRLNKCVGYFEEQSSFVPSLLSYCPRQDTRKLLSLPDSCIKTIESTPSCRTIPTSNLIGSACTDYISAHLNYAGCVRDYRADQDFYGSEWRVWMQRSTEFFRNTHDLITLKDQEGKVVSEYGY